MSNAFGPGSAGSRFARSRASEGVAGGQAPLRRSHDARLIAGVCAGLADHLGLPVNAVRAAMLVFGALGGAGALFYLWLWITVPSDAAGAVPPMRSSLTRPAEMRQSAPSAPRPAGTRSEEAVRDAAPSSTSAPTPPPWIGPQSPAAPSAPEAPAAGFGVAEAVPRARSRWPVAELLLGSALLIAGLGLVLVQLGAELDLALILPGMVVLVGVGLTWWQIADRDRPERNQLPRVLGALGLVAVGVLTFFTTAGQPSMFTVIAAALAVLAGVALALAPWLLRINRDLIAERAGRAREAERAEIAAHLHDSVLQTLAAIQQRSEPGSDIARLARGQERELREWLFRSADGAENRPREHIDVELRAHAVVLERDHPVRFEVIGVGTAASPGNGLEHIGAFVPEAIVAASREAMLNAARHAGGEVSVYVELSPQQVSVDITDRGPGLDLGALPEGRMGVRESIMGRMERAGGSARIVPGPGGTGTSVRLSMPMPTGGTTDVRD